MCWKNKGKEPAYIAPMLLASQTRLASEVKILLLGAGESGKSTIAKQLKIIRGDGFDQEELLVFKPLILSNIVSSMQNIIRFMMDFDIQWETKNQTNTTTILELSNSTSTISVELKAAIKSLLVDKGVQVALDRKNEFQLIDSAPILFAAIDRICEKNYIPTTQDVLTVRARTTGIVEICFQVDNAKYRVLDVGGQRSERKKWIHCFEDVTAIIYVVALSGYNQTLYECEYRNRLLESIELFDEICNQTWFVDTSILLFLNKMDLFAEKIEQGHSLESCFPHFPGPLEIDVAREFVRDEFLNRNRDRDKNIYSHFTTATNTKNMEFIFESINETLLQNALHLGMIH